MSYPDMDRHRPWEVWAQKDGQAVLLAQCESREEARLVSYAFLNAGPHPSMCLYLDIREPARGWTGERRDDAFAALRTPLELLRLELQPM